MKNREPIFFENLASTNEKMKELLLSNSLMINDVKSFVVLYTFYQTAGKGLSENRWESEMGKNLLVTFGFKPPVEPSKQFVFNQFFSLSVQQFLSRYVERVCIKWPNDIYLNNRKIAGILIEHFISNNQITHTIAGVGININQTEFSSDIPNPTSLKLLTGTEYSLIVLLKQLMTECELWYEKMFTSDCQVFMDEYYHHLYLYRQWACFCYRNKEIEAQIVGVDCYGRLQLMCRSGELLVCGLKEIKFCNQF